MTYKKKAWTAFIYNIVGAILPFIISAIAIVYFQKYALIKTFLDQGGVLLLSAGLYSTAIFVYGENRPDIKAKGDKFLSHIIVLCLVVVSVLYLLIYSEEVLIEYKFKTNLTFVRWSSLVLLGIAAIALFRSILLEQKKYGLAVNIPTRANEAVNDLMDQL